jgi:hypothetical protein
MPPDQIAQYIASILSLALIAERIKNHGLWAHLIGWIEKAYALPNMGSPLEGYSVLEFVQAEKLIRP